MDFFVHLHPSNSVGHLHIHCCLTNLWTQNGAELKEKNTRVHDVIKALELEGKPRRRSMLEKRFLKPGRKTNAVLPVSKTPAPERRPADFPPLAQ
jgi:hypothetical protein